MTKEQATDECVEIVNFYNGGYYRCSANRMVTGLMLPLFAIADGHQLISDEE